MEGENIAYEVRGGRGVGIGAATGPSDDWVVLTGHLCVQGGQPSHAHLASTLLRTYTEVCLYVCPCICVTVCVTETYCEP